MLIDNDPVQAFVAYDAVEVPGARTGPLRGLTFAVKDIFDVAGYPTGCGNPVKRSESPVHTSSAPAVQRLLDAGARFVGKTQTDELAFSINGLNRHFGAPVNRRAPGRITGGSSSGSAAAVAAGLCDFALGSDTGGSVRAPASWCGLFGLRPTHGRVPLEGAMKLAPSLDTAGYFADDARVFARVAPVLLGEDEAPTQLSRLLRADDAFALLASPREAEALAPVEALVADRLGRAEGVTVALEGLDRWYWTLRHLQADEAWREHGAWILDRDPEMTPGVRERFEFGRDLSPDLLAEAREARMKIRDRLDALLDHDAILMLPTTPSIAPLRDAPADDLQANRERTVAILSIAGLAGLPQVTMPVARLDDCPLGLSLIGPRGADRALADLAVAIAGAG